MQLIFSLTLMLLLSGCAIKEGYTPKTYESNLSIVTAQVPNISKTAPENYLYYRYKPWNEPLHVNLAQALWPWNRYQPAHKYYGENLKPRSQEWFDKHLKNAQFTNLGSVSSNAIISRGTNVRNFPTNLPLFKDPNIAGEGFPFDYNQNSQIMPFTPVWLSHYSADRMWAFIESDSFFGWVETPTVLPLSLDQQNEIKSAPKIVALEAFELIDSAGFYSTIPIGTLLPMDNKGDVFAYLPNGTKISFPIQDKNIALWPLEFTPKNLETLSAHFLNEPYGWGGLFGHRDCSAMTKDFLGSFGIWLPRNSKAQFHHSATLNLKGLPPKEKEQMIHSFAIPFLSLIYLPGHIMLYVGNIDNKPLVLHSTWGVKTLDNGKEGRYVIGKTILSDLHVGSDHPQADESASLISRIKGIATPNGLTPKQRLLQAYPEAIKDISQNQLFFHDNTSLPFMSQESYNYDNVLNNVDIQGQFIHPYPTLAPLTIPTTDPGRFRNEDFFKALYGKNQEEVEKELVPVRWLPSHTNETLLFHNKHGAAKALQKVSNELDKLPPEFIKYINKPAGTYNYRKIAGTTRLSMHSFGIAIDINTQFGDYWKWNKSGGYQNQIPKEIIHIFESNGFIWGGRWAHFDTFHFEYRPELTLP